ncbi:MAG: CRISPR-associated protein Cas4 [Zestosphaera sp.]
MNDISSSIDLINTLYRLSKEERERHPRRPEAYWVTDLVRCILKRDFELKYPELVESEVFTPTYILGTLVHKGLQELLKSTISNDVLTEVEGRREVRLPDNRVVSVEGRADLLIRIGEELVGVEIKTSRSDLELPKQHHVDQARIYNWLFNLRHTILIYVTPERVTQFLVEDRVTDEEVIRRLTISRFPRYEWECRYCSYSVLCPYKVSVR